MNEYNTFFGRHVMFFRLVAIMAIAFSCHVLAQGGEGNDGERIRQAPRSLVEAVELSLSKRLDIRLISTEVGLASARERQTMARFRPMFLFSVDFKNSRRWDDYAGISADYELPGAGRRRINVTSESPRYQLQPKLEVNYSVYAGGRDRAALAKARAQFRSSRYGQQSIVQRAILDVAKQYLDLRRSCTLWETTGAELSIAFDKLRLSRERYKGGQIGGILYREAQLSLREISNRKEQRAVEVRSAYSRYMTSVMGKVVEAVSVDGSCSFDGDIIDDIELLISSFPGETPEFSRKAMDIDAAAQQIEIERASRRPQVSLFGQYGYVGRRDHTAAEVFSDMKRQEAVMGIRVSYNLYDGGLSQAREESAQVELQRRQIEREQYKMRLDSYRARHRDRQKEVRQALDFAKERYELASARRSLVEDKFKIGRETEIARVEIGLREKEALAALRIAEIDYAQSQLDRHFFEAASIVDLR